MMTRERAILLMGPTGAGKTDVAATLAGQLPVEIVSVDAAMVYRGMDIGTAKPPPELLARAPHHLIDLIDPAESYSAARFIADATAVMRDIAARGRISAARRRHDAVLPRVAVRARPAAAGECGNSPPAGCARGGGRLAGLARGSGGARS